MQSLARNSPGEASNLCECGNRFRGTAGGEGVALRRCDRRVWLSGGVIGAFL